MRAPAYHDNYFGAPGITLSTNGNGSLCVGAATMLQTTWSNSTNFGASAVMYVPVILPREATVYSLGWFNGTTASGSIDCGLYDVEGNFLAHTGSTAQSGINAYQSVAVGPLTISHGTYYLAIVQDGTVGLLQGTAQTAGFSQVWRACGCQRQASTFPLPTTSATFATSTLSGVPLIMASLNSGGLF